jgi:hypothetical protein
MTRRLSVAMAIFVAGCSAGGGPGAPDGGGGRTGAGGAPGSGGRAGAAGAGAGGVPGSGGAAVGSGGATAAGGRGSGGATGGTACTRDGLTAVVASYLAALAAHDPSGAPLAAAARYTENSKETAIGAGLWKTAGAAKLTRSLVDLAQCMTMTEVVLPESGTDDVMTLRLAVAAGRVTEAEAIITRSGDWNFSAQGYLDSSGQTWDVLPADQRGSYDQLTGDAKVYLDYFSDKSVTPPFAAGCTRLEGGASMIACPTGFPSGGLAIGDRRYFADVEAGVSASISIFGGTSGNLDAHFFRVIAGTIRNVHSMTVNSTFTTTGWPP